MSQQTTVTVSLHMHQYKLLSGIPCPAQPHMSALISDHIAPSFLITNRRRRKKRVHNLAKRNQIVRAEQAAARRNALKIVNMTQRRPGNRDADQDCTGRTLADVAKHRHVEHRHTVVNLKPPTFERMKRVRDQSVPNITRGSVTTCIWKQLIRSAKTPVSPAGGMRRNRSLQTPAAFDRESYDI